ncbi:MAG: hypothetical protein A3H27_14010 [Acidobacteria bacterium RIFCSPLOWO2_02_FULL_59_13]|nr:MAG: hypothetical protein A3H27_14010 [Acidobacteria bacterium RIFCSPLOWO2_02_FULL_59_13]
MKVHTGVDTDSGLVHTVRATPANVADVNVLGELLHGGEESLHGDSTYHSKELKAHAEAAGVEFNANRVGMLAAGGINGFWVARLLQRADRHALATSRVMTMAIGWLSLGDHSISIDTLQRGIGFSDVMRLPFGENEPRQIAQPLDQRVDLGAQSATRAPDRLLPFFSGTGGMRDSA